MTLPQAVTARLQGRYKEELKRAARRSLGERSISVEIIPGDSAPVKLGDYGHYETKGGKRITYASAYRKKGWSNIVYYVGSTRRIEVGADWEIL